MRRTLEALISDKLIMCSCEGTAEAAIIELLMDADKLHFTKENLVDHDITTYRKASEIEEHFLHRDYSSRKVIILRILDRIKEKFKLGPLLNCYPSSGQLKKYNFTSRQLCWYFYATRMKSSCFSFGVKTPSFRCSLLVL